MLKVELNRIYIREELHGKVGSFSLQELLDAGEAMKVWRWFVFKIASRLNLVERDADNRESIKEFTTEDVKKLVVFLDALSKMKPWFPEKQGKHTVC